MTPPTDDLEDLFAAARRTPPQLSEAFLNQLQDEAARMQPNPARPRGLAFLLAVVGGWPAVVGVASAGVVGVWLGIAQPEVNGVSVEQYLYGAGDLSVDAVSGFDIALEEML